MVCNKQGKMTMFDSEKKKKNTALDWQTYQTSHRQQDLHMLCFGAGLSWFFQQWGNLVWRCHWGNKHFANTSFNSL